MGQQAVNAGDSYVIDMLNVVAHQFGGDYGFFSYRNVAGSGGHDHDYALAVLLAIALQDDGSRQGTILRAARIFGEGGGYGFVLFFGGTRGQDVPAVGREAGEDGGYLVGRFAWRKDHLGHALAQGAMVVELGEAEVLKGQVTQALDGVVGGEALSADLVEELAQGLGVHRCQKVIVDFQFAVFSCQFSVNRPASRKLRTESRELRTAFGP
jgi:hypothetical protein